MTNRGVVTQAKATIVDTLNSLARAVAQQATRSGYQDVKAYYIKDFSGALASRVEIQFGNSDTIPKSQVVEVQIFDDNNLKVAVPNELAQMAGLRNFEAFGSLAEAQRHLADLYGRFA